MAKHPQTKNLSPRIANRRATHDYHISEKLEVGIVLRGSEVKSVRQGQVSLAEGYVMIDLKTEQLILSGVEISRYLHAGQVQHETKRPRKLLAHKRQIRHLMGKTTAKGTTIVPLAMYFSRGLIKLEIGIGVGKKTYDKRQDMKKREARREIDRAMTRRRI